MLFYALLTWQGKTTKIGAASVPILYMNKHKAGLYMAQGKEKQMAKQKVRLQTLASIMEGTVTDKRLGSIPFLSIYGKETEIGHTSRKYPMSAGHINISGSANMPKTTRLSMAAFMLKCVSDKNLKEVRKSNDVFMKFRHPKGRTIACRAYMEPGQVIHLSYQKMPEDEAAILIPAAVLATAMNENCMKLYTDFTGKVRIGTVYQFCDTVLYEFLMACQENAEVSDDLSMETMKQAVSCGYYSEFPFLESPLQGEVEPKRSAKQAQKGQEGQKEAAGPDLSSYQNGEHIIRHKWGEEQKKRVIPPDFLDTFVPIPEFFRLMKKLDVRIGQNMAIQYECGLTEPEHIRRDAVNVLLYGNPGTGKTMLAHALSAATGMPLYEVKFDKYTESDEVEGKNKIVAGKLAFTGTDFLEGYEKGGILLLEEINCADQNVVTGALNNAIEYPFFIMKDGYQKVNRNPFTVIIATMNVGTEGTMWLNQSFASRFKQKYRIADPSTEDFIRFLTSYGYSWDAAAYVHDAYVKVMNLLTSNRATAEYALNLSTRACLGALENMSEGEDAKAALIDTVVGTIGIVDPQTADNISRNVIGNLPDFKPAQKTP